MQSRALCRAQFYMGEINKLKSNERCDEAARVSGDERDEHMANERARVARKHRMPNWKVKL